MPFDIVVPGTICQTNPSIIIGWSNANMPRPFPTYTKNNPNYEDFSNPVAIKPRDLQNLLVEVLVQYDNGNVRCRFIDSNVVMVIGLRDLIFVV